VGRNSSVWKSSLSAGSSSATDAVDHLTTYTLSCPSVASHSVTVNVTTEVEVF
jgi:hypothetical protein